LLTARRSCWVRARSCWRTGLLDDSALHAIRPSENRACTQFREAPAARARSARTRWPDAHSRRVRENLAAHCSLCTSARKAELSACRIGRLTADIFSELPVPDSVSPALRLVRACT